MTYISLLYNKLLDSIIHSLYKISKGQRLKRGECESVMEAKEEEEEEDGLEQTYTWGYDERV